MRAGGGRRRRFVGCSGFARTQKQRASNRVCCPRVAEHASTQVMCMRCYLAAVCIVFLPSMLWKELRSLRCYVQVKLKLWKVTANKKGIRKEGAELQFLFISCILQWLIVEVEKHSTCTNIWTVIVLSHHMSDHRDACKDALASAGLLETFCRLAAAFSTDAVVMARARSTGSASPLFHARSIHMFWTPAFGC